MGKLLDQLNSLNNDQTITNSFQKKIKKLNIHKKAEWIIKKKKNKLMISFEFLTFFFKLILFPLKIKCLFQEMELGLNRQFRFMFVWDLDYKMFTILII